MVFYIYICIFGSVCLRDFNLTAYERVDRVKFMIPYHSLYNGLIEPPKKIKHCLKLFIQLPSKKHRQFSKLPVRETIY